MYFLRIRWFGFGEMAGHQTCSTFEILRYSEAECHNFINGSMR